MRRNEDGAAAVEFGLIAFPFFFILFSIMEVSLVFFANQILDNSVSDAARLIRTGQAQEANFSKAEFQNQVCAGLAVIFDCSKNKIYVDVKTFTKFADVTIDEPIQNDQTVDNNFGAYDDGGPEAIVVARVYIEWPLITGFIQTGLSNLASNNRLLASVATFRNEPFPVP